MKLDAELKTQAAPALIEALQGKIGESIEIDASEVRFLGGACLQALLSATESGRAAGGPITIVDASDSFLADVETLGALDLLNIQRREPA